MNKACFFVILPLCAGTMLAQGMRGDFGPRDLTGYRGRGPGLLGAGPGMGANVTGAPYSATETLTTAQTLTGGNQISRTQVSAVARDSSGRMSISETFTPAQSSGKSPYTIVTIFDPVAGFRYQLNSSTMVAMKTTLPKPHTDESHEPRTPPSRPNMTTSSLGTTAVNGVSATGRQITDTIPAGGIGNAQPIQIVRVTWVSDELHIPVQIKSSDPRFGTSDMELTNISQTEPNASLFTVPSGYTIKDVGRGPGRPGISGRREPNGAR